MHGSRRAAGAVEASLAIALQSEAQQLDDEVAHVGLKRSRGLECAPSLKTSSSTEIARMQSSVHAAVTVSALDGALLHAHGARAARTCALTFLRRAHPRVDALTRACILRAVRLGERRDAGAFKPTERVYRGQSAPRLAVLERAAIDLATAAGGRALAPGRCDRRPQGACRPQARAQAHSERGCPC